LTVTHQQNADPAIISDQQDAGQPIPHEARLEGAFSVLAPDGSLLQPDCLPSPETMLTLYRQMRRARYFDERAVVLQRQGKLGVFAPFGGQEAVQIACAHALGPNDWLVPSYRETAAALTFGLSYTQAIMYWRTTPQGFAMQPGLNLLPFYIPIATQIPHTAGIAHAQRLQGRDNVAMGFIGDGGTSEGDFHVGLNFAGALNAPAIFVISNNGWAISVPTSSQTKAPSLAARAIGYGIPGVRVDGNDVLACWHVAQAAVARARRGDGPTLIEAITYRVRPHTTSDDPGRYRLEDEAERWRRDRDPLERLAKFLSGRKLWSTSQEQALVAEYEAELRAAVIEADAMTEPEPWQILEHVFAEPIPALREQINEIKAITASTRRANGGRP
jgi:pyruvate dehydrogenase E1 component alpha subunit